MAKPHKREKAKAPDMQPDATYDVEEGRGKEKKRSVWMEVREDWDGLVVLMVLYILQGVPMGLAGAIPMILKEKGVALSSLGTFTLSSLPFSMKVLWAPVVDAIYMKSFGRRKTWMIPCQLLIAAVLCTAPIGQWVDQKEVTSLSLVFTLLYFLCATQDIAVDGWALTILSEKNVSYGSVCNSAGQTLGFFTSLTGYLTLNSYGILDLSQFCFLCGVSFFVATITIAVLKKEITKDDTESIASAYKGLWSIVTSRPLKDLMKLMLFNKIPFCLGGIAALKVQDNGMHKETLALISTCIVPVNVLTPVVFAKWITGNRPLDTASKMYLPRVFLTLPTVGIVLWSAVGEFTWLFYAVFVVVSILENVAMTLMFSASMSFYARVSDSSLGGSYMTILNTITNLGSLWVLTLSLKICDSLSFNGIDGFYTLAFSASVYGVVWYLYIGRALFDEISSRPKKEWLINLS